MVDDRPIANDVGTERHMDQKRRGIRPLDSRKSIAIVISAAILIAAFASVIILTQPDDTVKVVAILAEEGKYSHTDEIEMSLQMVVEDVNRWNGISGKRIELVVEKTTDDNASIAETFSAAERDHHPLFYVTAGCDFLNVLGPLAEESQAPLIGMGSTPGLTEGFDWVYRFTISASAETDSAIRLFNKLDIASIGILYSMSPHSCGIFDALIDSLSETGMVVESEGFVTADELPGKISGLSDNQAIFCVGSCSELALMLPAVQESDFDGYKITASCGSTPLLWNTLEGEDVYVSAPLIYKPENVNARDYVLRFESMFNASATHHGAVAHDIVDLVHGLLEGMDPTRENLEQELDKGFILSGVLGIIRVDSGVHDLAFDVYPAVISEGELRYL
jgi:ABC-type branched-subunit amino acid transport system substrate-binding protein